MNTSPELSQLIASRIRADVRAMHAYAVQDAAGLLKLDAMENPYTLPPLRAPGRSQPFRAWTGRSCCWRAMAYSCKPEQDNGSTR